MSNLMDFRFSPESEPNGTTYAIQSVGDCEDGVGSEGIGVTIRKIDLGDGKNHYYAYHGGSRASFGPCDYLYTKNGIPVIPAANPSALASSFRMQKDVFVLGSVIWVPRGVGKSSLYTMMHELGHSFGLTDVAGGLSSVGQGNNLVYDEITGSYVNMASSETELMTWVYPTGKKLRYRDQQVAPRTNANNAQANATMALRNVRFRFRICSFFASAFASTLLYISSLLFI